ncbi:MAG TPA: right-handed parallel beta-helix repeat-containing protein, partial [Anaerolineae bacterium]|nr:right-handed parallel beta-helix repeat-containing protein [Anaerolineae bacterium]
MKHFVLKLSMALTLGAGLAIVLLWSLGRRSTELPIAHAGELRVCPVGCTYSSIQAAVDAANTGDIVKVAVGTYTGVSARAGVTQVVYISATITIQGGYTTTNWTTPYPITQPTTLDAQGQGGVMYITGNVSPTVEGLHITGGASFFDFNQDLYLGGGMYVVSATPTISGNWVFSNTLGVGPCLCNGGGGLFLWHSKATVRGNRVYSNTSMLGGGLMLSESDATLSGNWVFGNISSRRGGGLALVRSAAAIIGNSIFSNSASTNGGGIHVLDSAATI